MSLRLGVDLDGTVADLSAIYHEFEETLFGARTDTPVEATDSEAADISTKQKLKAARAESHQRDEVWRALRRTPNLWTLLQPIEPGAVRALYEAAARDNWEVFFITQRPRTAGASVQAQSQRWLIEQGFETPSVLTLTGSRGKAAHALDLDFLIDDLPKNCVDVVSDSRCRPMLIQREPDKSAEQAARQMNIGIVRSIAEAIDLLQQPAEIPRESKVANVLRRLGLAR